MFSKNFLFRKLWSSRDDLEDLRGAETYLSHVQCTEYSTGRESMLKVLFMDQRLHPV